MQGCVPAKLVKLVDDLRVLIIADDPLVRTGLAAMLAQQPGCLVVGQVPEESDLLSAVEVYRPQAVLWDMGWERAPDDSVASSVASPERLAELAEAGVPVVALISNESQVDQIRLAGALGLLARDASPDRLMAALEAAAHDLVVLDPSFMTALPGGGDSPPALLVEPLTPRELEVLQLLAEGLPNKAIAHRLGISEHTVKFHVNAVLGKLGVQSRTEAVVHATRRGLILL